MRNPSSSPATTASTSKTPCCSKVGIKKGPWTPEEDDLLANYIRREGEGRWRTLPKRAGLLRCGKSCRLRWMNYLRPCVKRGQIAPDEEDLILRLHRLLGNRWALIAGRIPGRTDNEIKNYWNTHLSKKLISQGIDPRTHKPLNPSPNPNSSRIIDSTAPNSNPNPNLSGAVDITSPNPNPNPNPNSSATLDITSPNPNPDPNPNPNPIAPYLYQLQNPVVSNTDEKLQNFDGFMTGSGHDKSNSNEEDYIACCNDETFSSFLNSLINEDLFGNQPNVIAPPVLSQPVTTSTQPFDHGTLWEAAYGSTMAALGDQHQGLK